VHLAPFFGATPLEEIDEEDVDALIAYERSEGKAPKSIRNWVGFLHSIFAFAEKRKWAHGNPCTLVDLPADVVVGPYLSDEQEREDVREIGRPEREKAVQQVAVVRRWPDLQDEQGDGDREDGVAERHQSHGVAANRG
jgi:site-specific recombinase XerD